MLSYIKELSAHCNAVWLNFLFSTENGWGKLKEHSGQSNQRRQQQVPAKPKIAKQEETSRDHEEGQHCTGQGTHFCTAVTLQSKSFVFVWVKNGHFDISLTLNIFAFLHLWPYLPTQNWHNSQEKLWSHQTTSQKVHITQGWIYQSSLKSCCSLGLADEPDTSVKLFLGGTGPDY